MRSYRLLVGIRKLFAMLIALSVLFAPSVAYASMPMSMAPHHDMQMMEMGHCEAPPGDSANHEKADGKSCCMSMCTAVAISPSAPLLDELVRPAPAVFAVPSSLLGYLEEIATPPPRSA